MAEIEFVKVIDTGPGWNKVLASDGKTYTFKGDYNWRSNNPGNIEYGKFAISQGAIGSGAVPKGRERGFAIFPSYEAGERARTVLQFEGKAYRDKTIAEAISRYAPRSDNNNPTAYAAAVAKAAGVSVNTKMSDLTPAQRQRFLAAQVRVEGMRPGTIKADDGAPVSHALVKQFSRSGRASAVPLPPTDIPAPTPAIMSASLRNAAPETTALSYAPQAPTVNDPFLATAIAAMGGKKRSDMSRIPGSPFFDKGLPGNVSGTAKLGEEEWAQLNAADPTVGGLGSLTGSSPFPMVPSLPQNRVMPPLPRPRPASKGTVPIASAVKPPVAGLIKVVPGRAPAKPAVPASGRTVAQIGQEADNARLSGYRSIQEMGPSSKGAPVRPSPPTPRIPGEYLGGAGGAGIAGQVQLPHDVRPSVTIPKLPDTPSVPQYIPQTYQVQNPAWTAPSGMAVNSSGQVMSQSALDAIRGVPANSYQKPLALSANMRGTNRTPVMAQYLTKTRMVPNQAYVAPPLPRPRPSYAGGQNNSLGGLVGTLFGGRGQQPGTPPQPQRSQPIPFTRAALSRSPAVAAFQQQGMTPAQAYAAANGTKENTGMSGTDAGSMTYAEAIRNGLTYG